MLCDIRACCVNVRQRWVFAVMCFLGLFHAYAMRACLSIVMTKMVPPIELNVTFDDTCPSAPVEIHSPLNTTLNSEGLYDWSEHTQGLILSSFYYGYVITHLPGATIAERYGGKHTYGLGIFLTAIFTLLTPLSVNWGDSTGLIITRILMGLGEGVTYPAINVLLSQWIPPDEKSRISTFVFAGQLLGTIYANSVSGMILQHSDDWSSVFYLIGGASAIWYFLWLALCYNNPQEHPFISKFERDYLNQQLSEYMHKKPPPTPWKHVLRSKPLWATIIAMLGFNWSLLTIVTDLPKYMSSVLKFSVENNGYVNSLIYLCMWIGSFITSWSADYVIAIKFLSTTSVRKIGSVLALSSSATFVIVASYIGCDQVLVIVMFAVAMSLMGSSYPSVMVNTLDLSPNYSGTLMALSNGISAGITGIVSPYIIGVITPNQTLSEWRLVFWILFAISISANLIFVMFGNGEIEYWNEPDFAFKNKNKKVSGSKKTNFVNGVV